MGGRGLRCGAIVLLLVGWLLAAAPVAADGIPSPIPGATNGPSGDVLQSIATSDGLTCQPDPGGAAGEVFCLAGAGSAYVQTATFFTQPALVLVASAGGTAPIDDRALPFLSEMAKPFCSSSQQDIQAFFANSIAGGFSPAGYTMEDTACRLVFNAQDTSGHAFRTVTAFSLPGGVLVSAAPSGPLATASAAPGASAVPLPGPVGARGGPATPAAFARSVPTPAAISTELGVILQSGLLALVIVLLMPFPATLFNSTLEKHYEEVRGWFPRMRLPLTRPGARGFWTTPIGLVAFVGISAVLYGLLDPDLGLNAESAAEVVGIGLGILLTALIFELPVLLSGGGGSQRLRVLPGTLVVGALCVLISRLTGFLPGYVYGLIIGFALAHQLSVAEAGRRAAAAGGLMLGLAVIAWLATGLIGPTDLSVPAIAVRTILAAVVVGGLEGVVFGLLPLRFLRGEALYTWNRILWGVIFGLGVFTFAHILLNPTSGYLSDATRTPFLTIVGLFIGFGALSLGFWGYFRYRPERPEPEPDAPAA